jgi:hypothetical protein
MLSLILLSSYPPRVGCRHLGHPLVNLPARQAQVGNMQCRQCGVWDNKSLLGRLVNPTRDGTLGLQSYP